MQLIHTAYSLSVIVEDSKWKDQWRIANQEKMGAKMKAPVLTRWEHVGEGATFLDEKWDNYLRTAQGVINNSPTSSTANTIASNLYSLIQEVVF